ncbi:transcriptional regulator [Streptomyces sp. NBC_00669]|uniref:helix-turn-helix domain-containing protein n=1 Tax=Streptomyces sp. NBC_00669 TaxID=2976011 RepID=UPI002E34F489|nr:helix-turn-helix transcriptional regulator [Streptomyces sp. NBC_00669]
MSGTEAAPHTRSRPLQLFHEPEAVTWARETAGLTKNELAARVGFSVNLLTAIERGNRTATPSHLAKIADALDCPLVDLERKQQASHILGPALRELRLLRDISLASLASRTGFDPRQIARMEFGLPRVEDGRVMRLASVLEVPFPAVAFTMPRSLKNFHDPYELIPNGPTVRAIRECRHLSLRDVIERIARDGGKATIDRGFLSRLENGISTMSSARIVRLAIAIDAPISAIACPVREIPVEIREAFGGEVAPSS